MTFDHIRNISAAETQLLMTWFWWNFKYSFLGTSRKDSNFQVDICPGNICPGDISGISQLSLTRCWPNFRGRILEPTLTDANRYCDICPVNICPWDICPYFFLDPRLVNLKFLQHGLFLDQKVFGPNFFLTTTTTITTTTTKTLISFDTIEIKLVYLYL